MAPRGRAGWLPSALLLLQLPGCLSLSGPSRVTGIVGGSLSVECQYKEVFINNSKYWCKAPCLLSVEIVETRESEREVRRGRVSIRDRPANLTFTVTLESLREEDAGRYRCGIETSWFEGILRDPTFQIEVFVVPGASLSLAGATLEPHMDTVKPLLQPPAPRGSQAPQALPRPCQCPPGAPCLVRRPLTLANLGGKGPMSQDIGTWVVSPLGEGTRGGLGFPTPGPSFIPTPDCEGPTTCLVLCCGCRPLLGSAHFLLLVFLKVPLLLGMLGAVLCVHRPLRSSADRQSVHL